MIILSTLLLTVAILIIAFLSKLMARTWINPASIFAAVWGIDFLIFGLVSDAYITVYNETWLVFLISMLAYYFGVATVMLLAQNKAWSSRNLSSEDRLSLLRQGLDRDKLRYSIYFIMFFGGAFFLYYLKSISSAFGVGQILFSLLDIRASMRDEGTFPGFHFLYFWEMLLPVTTVYLALYGRKKNGILFLVALLLTFCLIFTGAKTNIFKAVIWSFAIYMLLYYENVKFEKIFVVVVAVGGLGLFAFLAHTTFTGELSDLSAQFEEIMFRFSAQFPTFQLLLNDSSVVFSYGKLLFSPLAKVVHSFVPEFDVPSHILPFYNIPLPFNLATFLDIFYRDFGMFGVLIGPWIFGFVSAYSFYKYSVNKRNFFFIFLMSVFVAWSFESVNSAGFIKPSYWFQVILGYVIYRYSRKSHFRKSP